MRSSSNNPQGNALPKGLNDAALVEAISTSGYPLQGVVARQLQAWFEVVEEWDFIDDSKGEHRNLDVVAYRTIDSDSGQKLGAVCLLVECKRSRHPFVFFKKVTGLGPPRFPMVAGVPGGGAMVTETAGTGRSIELMPATALGIDLAPFVLSGPPTCATMSRATAKGGKVELSGAESFRELVLPLVKALRYSQGLHKRDQSPAYPVLLLTAAVLDAPMLLVEDPDTAFDPVLTPWVRFERREPNPERYAWTKTRFYGIDVVHSAFLNAFIADHLIPYIDLFRERLLTHGPLLDNRGSIDTIDNYRWERLSVRPVKGNQ